MAEALLCIFSWQNKTKPSNQMQRKRNIHQKLCLTLILTSATFFHNSDFFVFIFHFRLTSVHNTYCILFIQFGFYIFFCMNIILIFNFLFSSCLPTTQTMDSILCRIFVVAFDPNFNLVLIFFSYFVRFILVINSRLPLQLAGSGGQDYQGT